MMGTNCTKCYLLILAIHLIQKSLLSERAVVGVIMLNKSLRLSHDLLEGVHGEDRFVHHEILHEMNVNKITNVITKCSAPPDTSACKKT